MKATHFRLARAKLKWCKCTSTVFMYEEKKGVPCFISVYMGTVLFFLRFRQSSSLWSSAPQPQQMPTGLRGPFPCFLPVFEAGFSLEWVAAATPGILSFLVGILWQSYSLEDESNHILRIQ